MKKNIFAYLATSLFSTASLAGGTAPAFCSGAALSMTPTDASCITTCKAVAAYSAAHLALNTSGFCVGQASTNKIVIYEMALGRESAGSEPACKIWSGPMEIDRGGVSAGHAQQGGGRFDISSCPSGEYDVLFLTVSRFEQFAGSTVFPDGSIKIVRTTAAFANDNAPVGSSTSGWLEASVNHSDNSKYYVRPSSTWNTVYNKLGTSPSDADLSGTSEFVMRHDWSKQAFVNGSTSVRLGWACEDNSHDVCQRDVDSDKIQLRLTKNVSAVTGLPLKKQKENSLSKVALSYYAGKRGGDNELGIKVLWHRDGAGTLRYLGVYPGESGFNIDVGTPTDNGQMR